jgi:hypothetical protein
MTHDPCVSNASRQHFPHLTLSHLTLPHFTLSRLPQVDALVFSAGIGENSSIIRGLVLEPLKVRGEGRKRREEC